MMSVVILNMKSKGSVYIVRIVKHYVKVYNVTKEIINGIDLCRIKVTCNILL